MSEETFEAGISHLTARISVTNFDNNGTSIGTGFFIKRRLMMVQTHL